MSDDATGIANRQHIGRQIPGDHAAGAHHRIGPDRDAGADDGAARKPNAVFDRDGQGLLQARTPYRRVQGMGRINAAMSRVYKETFDKIGEDPRHAEHEVEGSFRKMADHAKEAANKIKESFEKVKESFEGIHKVLERGFEFIGITGVLSAVGGAVSIEELIKHGTEVRMKREEAVNTLAATLRGRGRVFRGERNSGRNGGGFHSGSG